MIAGESSSCPLRVIYSFSWVYSLFADMFFERYFATAMALFAFCLSAGSQIGPMVAGFLIASSGWRWFFIVCTILTAVNLLTSVFFLPETTFRRVLHEGETAAEIDKATIEQAHHLENKEATIVRSDVDQATEHSELRASYWKDLAQFQNRGLEPSGLRSWPSKFLMPFRFILVPSVLFATCSYGIVLAG
jgi:MFS family permease